MGNSEVLKSDGSRNVHKCKRQNLAVVLTWYQKHYLFWICSFKHLTSYSGFWNIMAIHLSERTSASGFFASWQYTFLPWLWYFSKT